MAVDLNMNGMNDERYSYSVMHVYIEHIVGVLSQIPQCLSKSMSSPTFIVPIRGRRGRDHMIVGFTTTCAINAYHH